MIGRMSYDRYLLPTEYCTDGLSADAFVATQRRLPATGSASALAARITARNFPDHSLRAKGGCVCVSTPSAEPIDESVTVIAGEAIAAGYGVYDPQSGLVVDPRGATAGELTTPFGTFPVIPPETARFVIDRLEIDDFLIAETRPNTYAQAMRLGDNDYQVEYRDGSPEQHYSLRSTTAHQVSSIFDAWICGDKATLKAYDWESLQADRPRIRLKANWKWRRNRSR